MDALRYTLRGAAGTRPALAMMVVYWLLAVPGTARASFLHGEALDNLAEVMSWIVIVVVPVIGIAVFWLVHILPEKIAEKKHHPQAKAIQCLCLLSLFFGGLLWPIAWLWAYSKPVLHKLAYGTDREHHSEPPPEEKKEEKVVPARTAAAPINKEGGKA